MTNYVHTSKAGTSHGICGMQHDCARKLEISRTRTRGEAHGDCLSAPGPGHGASDRSLSVKPRCSETQTNVRPRAMRVSQRENFACIEGSNE